MVTTKSFDIRFHLPFPTAFKPFKKALCSVLVHGFTIMQQVIIFIYKIIEVFLTKRKILITIKESEINHIKISDRAWKDRDLHKNMNIEHLNHWIVS